MRIRWGSGRWRAVARPGAMAACLVLLAACGGDTSPDPGEMTPAPTARATRPAETGQQAQPLELSDVVWTTQLDAETGEPLDEVSSFPNDAPAIIAAVSVAELPAGAELTATWAIDGVDVPEATMRVTSEGAVTDAWVTFRFDRAAGRLFPLGELQVTITASDGESVSGEVEITVP